MLLMMTMMLMTIAPCSTTGRNWNIIHGHDDDDDDDEDVDVNDNVIIYIDGILLWLYTVIL